MRKTFISIVLLVALPMMAQLSQKEIELYQLIMEYRAEKGLPEIPLSVSLTEVAQIHAKDVYEHFDEIPKGCNAHSWSKHGNWTKCDYYPDHRNAACVWSKPNELTEYDGNGYEIIHFYDPPTSGIVSPKNALNGWKSSPGHNAMMINLGQWESVEWGAIGVGMYKGVACAWFGEYTDPAGHYIIEKEQ